MNHEQCRGCGHIFYRDRPVRDGLCHYCVEDEDDELQRVLIIWSDVPDKIGKFFALSLGVEAAEKIQCFNGEYINSGKTPDELSAEMFAFFYDEQGHFKFANKEVEGPLVGQMYDVIVQCGYWHGI